MALLYTSFIAKFPEFANATQALVQKHLDDALLEIDPAVWGPKADAGQGFLAAHTLALSPFGQGVRLVQKDGTTTYNVHYKRLQRQVSSGGRVT